jgi:hypothetical protein
VLTCHRRRRPLLGRPARYLLQHQLGARRVVPSWTAKSPILKAKYFSLRTVERLRLPCHNFLEQ